MNSHQPGTPSYREPTAELRAAALNVRQMFNALVEQGFSDHQALVIIGQMLAGAQPR